ncbi:hypothetical protein EYZ11_010344 [Aspergillus tanneri]|uniref:SH3b domain-containing protein n=1 Tax=Aspergillus tanneri TaxID=1220188 RepID=A0A4S3J5I8_9EURO|nr:uncharacterized protein ATNIH1004_006507 [Aspergillus tanneri]KAA8647806.1 hypothetical protein ATNIH1004_006507 [Aspergillus tanneri]THC90186.1 hypothetical protein EYZ11_010344 [Aspergillus tanneri]
MKFSAIALAALLPATALSAAIDAEEPHTTVIELPRTTTVELPRTIIDVEARDIEKRAVKGTVVANGLRYRTCPRSSCTAVGQYAKGTRINLVCYTRENTTPVNGDKGWGKLTNGNWVALAFYKYVTWDSSLPAC